ncbi:hypothetical protein AeMF1_002274 [Aphanomyces euteiches]|nr:hypothetical protein AeMF1_002274 [Aphanomyces euteiches]KAH9190971.1 hypothetical protein AeNC1_007044 [Aphanomyces euteiches]
MKRSLELSAVKFVSQPGTDAFRVQVFTTDDDVPMKIWIENKRSKDQWECVVKDVAEHTPKGAKYVLPSPVVVVSLLTTLSAKSEGDKKDECSVDLKPESKGSVTLTLTMKALKRLSAEYLFTMTRLEIAPIDVLEAKIRDLQEEMAQQQTALKKQENDMAALQNEMNSLRTTVNSRYGYGY